MSSYISFQPFWFPAGGVALVVKMYVKKAELSASFLVLETYPVAMTGSVCTPRHTAADERIVAEPVASAADKFKLICTEKDNIFPNEVITICVRIHFRADKAVRCVFLAFLFKILIGVIDDFLHAKEVRLSFKYGVDTEVAAVLPYPFREWSIVFQTSDADIA